MELVIIAFANLLQIIGNANGSFGGDYAMVGFWPASGDRRFSVAGSLVQ
jgi:hypothetical protein